MHRLVLPRLPVPDLRKTLDRYLTSLEPFLLEDEARGGPSFRTAYAQRAQWADEFAKGIGRICQDRLIALDKKSPNNWLDDNFWLRKAYLEWRAPLLVNSNWWLTFVDDQDLRAKMARKERLTSYDALCLQVGCSPWQIRRAAWLLHRVLDFKNKIDNQEIHPDTTRTGIWLRENVHRMFGHGRSPRQSCDVILEPPHPNPHADQVIVMVHDWFYQVTISSDRALISSATLEARLLGVMSDVYQRLSSGEQAPPIGVLSADQRDTWGQNLQYLLDISPKNQETYDAILYSLMNLSLETSTYSLGSSSPSKSGSQRDLDEHLHTIRSVPTNVSNRFFDSTFTLIVDPSTRAGATGEHAPCDALVPSIVAEYAVIQPVGEIAFRDSVGPTTDGWRRLDWVIDDKILKECLHARNRAEKIIADSDNSVMWFDDYGSDWIKAFKLSPDAFFQMALQLAWYRTRGEFVATYETVLTRMFNKGRTETVRTLTRESRAFVLAMSDPSVSTAQQSMLLYSAVQKHAALSREAATGRGIDRHLLGLYLLLRDGEHVELFQDKFFGQSSEWKLSTSALSAGHQFRGTGFGAVYDDGYGISYLIAPEMIKFGIESKLSNALTSTEQFKDAVALALADMRRILLHVEEQQREVMAHL